MTTVERAFGTTEGGGGRVPLHRRLWSGRLGGLVRASPMFAILAALMACLLVPVGIGVYMSFRTKPFGQAGGEWTLHNYGRLIHDTDAWSLLGNTLILTICAAGGATIIGATLAWIITNTNVPGAKYLIVLPMAPMLLPGLLKCTAWIDLYAPQGGLVNLEFVDWFGFDRYHPPFDIFTMKGMIVILALSGAPIAYLIMLTPFGNLGRSYDEASRVSGAGRIQTLFRIILPSVRPALLSAFALCAILVATSFETPILIGLPGGVRTYISAIYSKMSGGVVPEYNLTAAYASVYLVLTGLLLFFYVRATRSEKRFAVVTGRDYVRQRIDVGRWRWLLLAVVLLYFFLAFFQLVLGTLLVSLIPYYTATQGNPLKHWTLDWWRAVLNQQDLMQAVTTSIYLAGIGAIVTTFAATMIALASFKSKLRFRRLFEVMATLPVALPSFVFSTLLLLTVLFVPGLLRFYNTRWPLIVAFAIISLPLAVRVMSGTVIQLNNEFSEASSISGASKAQTNTHVTLPLLRSAIVDCASAVFSHNFKELGAIILLVGPNTLMLPTLIFEHWETGDFGTVAALNMFSLVISGLFIGAAMLFLRSQRRRGTPRASRRLTTMSETEAAVAAVE
jgi:iron(III) transport system permease protein